MRRNTVSFGLLCPSDLLPVKRELEQSDLVQLQVAIKQQLVVAQPVEGGRELAINQSVFFFRVQ